MPQTEKRTYDRHKHSHIHSHTKMAKQKGDFFRISLWFFFSSHSQHSTKYRWLLMIFFRYYYYYNFFLEIVIAILFKFTVRCSDDEHSLRFLLSHFLSVSFTLFHSRVTIKYQAVEIWYANGWLLRVYIHKYTNI